MAFCTIEEVRELAGVRATPLFGVKLYGTANGTNKDFYVPNRYIVDSDFDEDGFETSPDYTDDVTVYDDGVAVAVTSVDVNLGKITLTTAPAAASVMTVDYYASSIKDSQIVAIINKKDDLIKRKTGSTNTATSYTQYWDGDGTKKDFYFRKKPVVSITSYDIDGVTSGLTEGTDYWLYPEPARATWIEFNSAPVSDKQNVQITYNYGETSYVLSDLSKTLSAITVLEEHTGTVTMAQGTYTGMEMEPVFITEQSHIFLIRRLKEDVKELWIEAGNYVRASLL